MKTIGIILLAFLVIGSILFYVNTPQVVVGDDEFEVLTTEAQVQSYIKETFGIECVGDDRRFRSNIDYVNTPDSNGLLGSSSTTLAEDGTVHVTGYYYMTECLVIEEWDSNGNPKSGRIASQFWIDPNNGFVARQTCNSNLFPEECENIENKFFYMTDNPAYEYYYSLPIPDRR